MTRVKYVDMWSNGYDLFYKHISDICEYYDGDDPDFVICSCFGNDALKYDCPRILILGENLFPDFNLYDYAVSFYKFELGDRHLRFPLYAFDSRIMRAREKHLLFDGRRKEKFCNIVVSNNASADPNRELFFKKLNEYKPVDSGGSAWNNIGGVIGRSLEDKKVFQQDYRFTIAFENSSVPGYVTEKIADAWVAGTIPIYWGAPDIAEDFNVKSFINCHDYNNFDAVIARIDEIERDESLYNEIMRTPILADNSLAHKYRTVNMVAFLKNIFSQGRDAAKRRPEYGPAREYAKKTLSYGMLSANNQKDEGDISPENL